MPLLKNACIKELLLCYILEFLSIFLSLRFHSICIGLYRTFFQQLRSYGQFVLVLVSDVDPDSFGTLDPDPGGIK